MNIIAQLEKEQIAIVAAKRQVPAFAPGDTLIDGGNSYYVDDIRRAQQLGCVARSVAGERVRRARRPGERGRDVDVVVVVERPGRDGGAGAGRAAALVGDRHRQPRGDRGHGGRDRLSARARHGRDRRLQEDGRACTSRADRQAPQDDQSLVGNSHIRI